MFFSHFSSLWKVGGINEKVGHRCLEVNGNKWAAVDCGASEKEGTDEEDAANSISGEGDFDAEDGDDKVDEGDDTDGDDHLLQHHSWFNKTSFIRFSNHLLLLLHSFFP